MAASLPSDEQLLAKVPSLRETFQQKYNDEISKGEVYDVRDIERFKEDDRYAKCFVRSWWDEKDEKNIETIAEKVNEILRYRKEINLLELKKESFPKELLDENCLYWKGEDKDKRKIMYFKVANHKKGTFVQEMKNFISYNLEQHHSKTPGDPDRILMVFDFTGAGITNMDLDVVKFIISALSTYFPGILHRILLFEMPWLLSSVWKVIQSWLSKEQKDKITQVKKADIINYIDTSQLEPHMVK